jgi:hypothetical protein
MTINLDAHTYTFGEGAGAISIPMGELSESIVANAIRRAFNHVFGNEAASKVTTAKKTMAVDEAKANEIIAEAQQKYLASILAGTWGMGGRTPRGPSTNRLENIYETLLAQEVRMAAAKQGFIPVEGQKDMWEVKDRGVHGIDALKAQYLRSPTKGAEREERLRQSASNQYAREQEAAADRKARAAVAPSGKIVDLDDF